MIQFRQLMQHEVDSEDGYLVTVREVKPFQSGAPWCQGIDSLISQVIDSNESNPAQLL